MTATPVLASGQNGPAVSYVIPLFDPPAWLLGLLATTRGGLGTATKWGRSLDVEFLKVQHRYDFSDIPYLGFVFRESLTGNSYLFIYLFFFPFSLTLSLSGEYFAKLEQSGVAEFEGSGGFFLDLVPNCCSMGLIS